MGQTAGFPVFGRLRLAVLYLVYVQYVLTLPALDRSRADICPAAAAGRLLFLYFQSINFNETINTSAIKYFEVLLNLKGVKLHTYSSTVCMPDCHTVFIY